jgi:hypothetical protein
VSADRRGGVVLPLALLVAVNLMLAVAIPLLV